METLGRMKIVESLIEFGSVEVCSVKNHFVLLIHGDKMDNFNKVNKINETLKQQGVIDVYPNLQVMKNEVNYLLITMYK